MTTKDNVLALLLSQNEQPLSGEEMAERLSVSRTAIWKAIQQLKQEGHDIQAKSNVGYTYFSRERLNAEGIRKLLPPSLQTIEILVENEVDSTNSVLKRRAIDGIERDTLLLAENQTAGRGRFQRSYFSTPEDGLYMSLYIHQPQPVSELVHYTLITAVAMAQAIEAVSNKTVAIKWVNDLYIEGKKVTGVLSEATTNFETGMVDGIIIGIGTNVSVLPSHFPLELQSKAGSIFPQGVPKDFHRHQLVAHFLTAFYDLKDQPERYLSDYRARSFIIGQIVSFDYQQQRLQGKAIGISDSGELLVELPNQDVIALSSGEVSLHYQ